MTTARILEWIFRLTLGGLFFKAGYEKARDPIQFLFDIRNFQLLPDPWAGLLALGLPWLEIFCALGIVLRGLYAGALAIVSGSLIIFIAAIAWSWRRGLDISCGCFGQEAFDLSYTGHITLNAVLLGMALWLLWREARPALPGNPA